jgi:DNA polymerase
VNVRDEHVLRELNLYPLWVRRDVPLQAQPTAGINPDLPNPPPTVGRASARQALVGLKPDLQDEAGLPGPTSGRQIAIDWTTLKQQVRDCTACKLRAGCTQTVFGVGDEQADWLFVGEGPGEEEDALGEPFVGQAGKLLDNMLFSIGLKRGDNVYIANVVKCRPPNNRNPEADEIATCMPYLQQQIAHIKPKLIVALGKTAACALLGRDATLGSLRGSLHDYHGIPLLVSFHPAYLLRSPAEKAKAWQDLKAAMAHMR